MKTMKKYVRILLVAMMSLMVLALAGCGEEDKYNQAKQEVTAIVEQAKNVNDWKDSQYFSSDKKKDELLVKEHWRERTTVLQGELKKREELFKQADEKLKDMAGYAKGDGKLEADLAEFKRNYESEKNVRIQMSKEIIAAQKTFGGK